MNRGRETVNVYVWERLAGVHRCEDAAERYQADIIGAGFDHHGIAATPAEALLLAAAHWRAHEGIDRSAKGESHE